MSDRPSAGLMLKDADGTCYLLTPELLAQARAAAMQYRLAGPAQDTEGYQDLVANLLGRFTLTVAPPVVTNPPTTGQTPGSPSRSQPHRR